MSGSANLTRVLPPETASLPLDRAIVAAGLCSRTQALRAIAQGRVRVDGVATDRAGMRVDLGRNRIEVDGEPLAVRPREHWMLHKPRGHLTARVDPRGRPTVCSLLPAELGWLAPVGRLDLDTSGLLLFTNDGALAHAILAPSCGMAKSYLARCSGRLDEGDLQRLRTGVDIGCGQGPTQPAEAELVAVADFECTLRLSIREGRNRQVRRMIRALGHGVLELHRDRIGPLQLGALPLGHARRLEPAELAALRAAAGLG